jgi:uncharacterized protein DUF3560
MREDGGLTYRERRERRAERLRDWAAKREAKAEASLDRAKQIGDMIPFGQPILAGHHSEGRHRRDLAKIDGAMRRGLESQRMAESMQGRADNIDAQLRASIYSDDADAAEALRERIAGLEAERDRIKAYNATCRKGKPDPSLLDDSQRASLVSAQRWMPSADQSMPAYVLANLSSNISRQRQRLARLETA